MTQQTLTGKTIGHYRIEKMLGRGGMGAVYKGVDTVTGRWVAIKVMLMTLGEDPDTARRFEREARLAAEIDHPNCARVLEVGVDQDVRFLVMEYIDGVPLSEEMAAKGKITGSRCLDYIRQTARGLQAAQERGIIHRDIKPANLMLTRDGIIKIVDFGLARADESKNDSFKTATGAVMGTPHYISPEQACGDKIDHRADIYSLGATFYHLLTGHPPFSGDSPFAIIQKHIQMEVKSISVWSPNVPENVCQIVYRMLKKVPDDRYQTYGHLIRTIDDAIEGRAATMTMNVIDNTMSVQEAESDAADRSRWIKAALILGVFVIVGFAYKQYHDKQLADEAAAAAAQPEEKTALGQWKTETLPELHRMGAEIKSRDDEERNFESRRARMNDDKR